MNMDNPNVALGSECLRSGVIGILSLLITMIDQFFNIF